MGEDARFLWVDASAGAAGDMLLGALLDAGASIDLVSAAVAAVSAAAHDPIEVRTEAVRRHGFRATHAVVRAPRTEAHRTLAEILRIVAAAGLPDAVERLAARVFRTLAEAEAAVHGDPDPAAVPLHEVGALDALADVVATAAALDSLGLLETRARVVVSQVALGSGSVETAHGRLPVPAPAVLELMRAAGTPVAAGPAGRELCTPTGAALLVSLADAWGPLPPMRIDAVGIGAGTADPPDRPNVVRAVVGRALPGVTAADADPWRTDDLVEVETTVDDLDPRLWPEVLEALVRAGAADAWLTPVVMRKGRPGQLVTALVAAQSLDAAVRALFETSTTLGVRTGAVRRRALPRDQVTVEVGGCPVRVKRGLLDGRPVTIQPEFDDARAAAKRLGRPVRSVIEEAAAAARAGKAQTSAPQTESDGGSN